MKSVVIATLQKAIDDVQSGRLYSAMIGIGRALRTLRKLTN
jgi:hypothetical protein